MEVKIQQLNKISTGQQKNVEIKDQISELVDSVGENIKDHKIKTKRQNRNLQDSMTRNNKCIKCLEEVAMEQCSLKKQQSEISPKLWKEIDIQI